MSFFSIDQMEFAIVTILTMVNDLFHTKILQYAVVAVIVCLIFFLCFIIMTFQL